MEKAFLLQKQARDNVSDVKSYLADLNAWEKEMKRKEAALYEEAEQDLPPVRTKTKKKTTIVTDRPKAEPKRISSSDYKAWDKFDVDAACEAVDTPPAAACSLDSRASQPQKEEKLRLEAQKEKEEGNKFVKLLKYDDAIACYTRAIDLYPDDAIFYGNRAQCYLKKDELRLAEADCTRALDLDQDYVKAWLRRAEARARRGSTRAAASDLRAALALEPTNSLALTRLRHVQQQTGNGGSNTESSPATTPTSGSSKVMESKVSKLPKQAHEPKPDAWADGSEDNVCIIQPITKPPHQRSKKPLKHITIEEIPLGMEAPVEGYQDMEPATRLKIIEIEDTRSEECEKGAQGDSLADKDEELIPKKDYGKKVPADPNLGREGGDACESSEVFESTKLRSEEINKEKSHVLDNLEAPINSVQFESNWKYLKDIENGRSKYLSLIDPAKIPSIFGHALESDTFSDILVALHHSPQTFADCNRRVHAYLEELTHVKRFSALAMFMSPQDQSVLHRLLEYCAAKEDYSQDQVNQLRNKYEL